VAYDDQKGLTGREPVAFVEMDFNACSLTYGTGDCTASGSGDSKCFNSYATCQDKDNFAPTTKTLRFSNVRIDDLQGDSDVPTFPTLASLSLSPTSLTPSQGLGIRSTCNITLEDHPFSMVGVDQYREDRTYNHADRGSFWSRFLTMFPYYTQNEVRVKTGFLEEDGTYDSANFITRTYFIDSIKGPDPKGRVQIKCKDILRFADKEKATVPVLSQATLDSDITDSATSFDVVDPNDDVKDAYDAGQTYIRIDDEVMEITNLTGASSPYTLTVTRATIPVVYSGSVVAEEHDEDSTVQQCHLFDNQPVDDIAYYLLNTGAGIDASYLPTSDWQDVINFGLQNYAFTSLITEPVGVKDLMEELSHHNIYWFWNEREGKVQMSSIINKVNTFGPFTDEGHIIADSVSVARDESARVSQVWMGFGQRTPVAELDEPTNYSSYYISVDADAEGSNEYDQRKIRRIYSRWLPVNKRTIVTEITNRYLNYYKDTKNLVSLKLDPKDDDAWTGDNISLSTRLIQDPNGTTPERSYLVLETNEITQAGNTTYQYKLQSVGSSFDGSGSRYGLIGPNTLTDYDVESDPNKNTYAFVAYDDRSDGSEGFPTTDSPYLII